MTQETQDTTVYGGTKGGTLPKGFEVDLVKEALKDDGLEDDDALLYAFTWDDTPQGTDYWEHRYFNGLDAEARSILEGWMAEAEAQQAPRTFRVRLRVRRKEARSHTHGGL